jgi:ABC-type molybdenum transport system ATPase subunit/photorepair protein PhrA
MSSVVIENVGAISSQVIPVPDGGGVVVMRGPNGIGKTTALDCVSALVNGGKPPSLRDGAKRGLIEGLGAKITVGLSSRRTGEIEVRSLEGRLDVSDIVDPGIASVEAADARRIRALVAVSGVTATAETFADLVPGGADEIEQHVSEKTLGSGDVLEIGGAVKRLLESMARQVETQAENAEGKAKTLAAIAGPVSEDEPHDAAKLQADFEDAVRRRQSLESQAAAWRKAQATIAECNAALSASESADAAVSSADELRSRSKALVALFDVQQRKIVDLERQLAVASAELQQTRNDIRNIDELLAASKRDKERTDALKKMLDEATLFQAVEANQVEAACLCVQMASDAMERGALVRERLSKRVEADAAYAEVKKLRAKAVRLRDSAAGTDGILSDLVAKLGVPLQVKVIDGKTRLVTETGRGVTPFSELSAGERWRMALDIAIEAVGPRGLLVIRQEAWEGLDPINRQEIASHCRERGAVVITAAASGGEGIETEVMQ